MTKLVRSKFLIIQTAFIGDVILATGLIEKLHLTHPAAKIDFLVRKGNENLLLNHPLLHKVLIWDKKKKYASLFQLLKYIRRQHYDTIVNVQRFANTGILTALSSAKETIGFDKNPFSRFFTKRVQHVISKTGEKIIHETDRNQSLIQHFTDNVASKPKLYPTKKDYDIVRQYICTPFIVIAPASVWFTKQYPKEKWINLIDKIAGNWAIYLIGGASDHAVCNEIISGANNKNVINLAGKLSLLQSAALQQYAHMNYVNDSSPMHLASAMNAPVTAVYCSTVPEFGFGPVSDKSFIVQTKEQLLCKPCGLHGYNACPMKHFKCAYTIKDEQLLEVLNLKQ